MAYKSMANRRRLPHKSSLPANREPNGNPVTIEYYTPALILLFRRRGGMTDLLVIASTTGAVPAQAQTSIQYPSAPLPIAPPAVSSAALWAAVIGAGSALLVSVLKDYFFERLKEARARRQSETDVYRQYLTPLCEACEKVVWRSKEIFIDKRHAFLKVSTLPLDFNAYKRTSTLYRVATLIGWIRGMTLELRALPRGKTNFTTPISKQIAEFQKALADGPHVELHRLRRLSGLWSINLSGLDQTEQAALAMNLEVEAHASTDGKLKSDPDHLRCLPRRRKAGDLPSAGRQSRA